MLQVRVGDERADRVEDDRRVGPVVRHGRRRPCSRGSASEPLPSGLSGRRLLEVEQAEGDDEERGVEGEHREGVLLPAHPTPAPSCRSGRQRNIGMASNPRPARSPGTSRERAISQPIGNEAAIGRAKAQVGMKPGGGRFHERQSPGESKGSRSGEWVRSFPAGSWRTRGTPARRRSGWRSGRARRSTPMAKHLDLVLSKIKGGATPHPGPPPQGGEGTGFAPSPPCGGGPGWGAARSGDHPIQVVRAGRRPRPGRRTGRTWSIPGRGSRKPSQGLLSIKSRPCPRGRCSGRR